MIDPKPLTAAAVDRIIDAVAHWGDDPDPLVQAFNYAWGDFTNTIIDAYKAKHGHWPGCRATVKFKWDDGPEPPINVKTEIMGDRS